MPDDYTAKVQHPGYISGPSQELKLRPGAPIPEVTIELDRTYTVRGRVVDETGKPVAGATVWLNREEGQERTTDEQGRFIFENLTKLWRLWAEAPGWVRTHQDLSKRTEPTQEVTLVLRYRIATVSGRLVRSDTQEPIPGALIIADRVLPRGPFPEADSLVQWFERPSV
jgi:hypothetical protein